MTDHDADTAALRLGNDLASAEPERVAAAVRELNLRWQRLQDVRLPAPPVGVLSVLDPATSEEVAVAYVRTLLMYDFSPPVTPRDRLRWTMEALLRHGGSRLATEVSLQLADPESFGSGPAEALTVLEELGLPDERARTAVSWLVSFLLGHPDLRQATLDAISDWAGRPGLSDVVAFVMPQLHPHEQARLRQSGAPPR